MRLISSVEMKRRRMLSCLGTLFILVLLVYYGTTAPTTTQLNVVLRALENQSHKIEVCDSTDNTENWFIYCSGDILAAMNVHKMELDPKTFVDRPLKANPKEVRDAFTKKFGKQPIENINAQELLAFRERYFDKEGLELDICALKGWKPMPTKIARIVDKDLKEFAVFLHERWKLLCRHVKNFSNPERHSLIWVPEDFIVPGGRFREFYYWDAYWIIKGLIVSDLTQMVKNMVTNFIHCVKKFGFVPNGGRIYYLRRSQPPFLIPMAYEYYEATKDVQFIDKNYAYLVQEFNFWMTNRSLTVTGQDGKSYTVYQYRTPSNVPRPESFRTDVEAAVNIRNENRAKFFQDTASAAESGWDFSSRWFSDKLTIQTIETTNVVPVDLNALLCLNANILKYFAKITGRKNDEKKFEQIEEDLSSALKAVFYDTKEKAWFDYNIRTASLNTLFYPSVAMPLFTNCYQQLDYEKSGGIVDFMNRTGVFTFKSGIPTSLAKNVGQQWDFPNGWSPLQHIVIEGMRKSDNPDVQEMAYLLARKWVLANYEVYRETNKMWEKIDVIGNIPKPGSGGEYDVQDGFGWTNGVILDLLATYYNRITVEKDDTTSRFAWSCPKTASSRLSWQLTILLMFSIITFHLYRYQT